MRAAFRAAASGDRDDALDGSDAKRVEVEVGGCVAAPPDGAIVLACVGCDDVSCSIAFEILCINTVFSTSPEIFSATVPFLLAC